MRRALLVGCALLVACGGAETSSKTEPTSTAAPANDREAACAAIADWRPEVIELPPEFAPTLPRGREELRFAPGMFKPESDEYFTYAFVLAFADKVPLDEPALESLLTDYFRGLMSAVAKSRKVELETEGISVALDPSGEGFQGSAALVDAFVTGKPFGLNLVMDIEGTCLRVRASPKAAGHPLWATLEQAIACLPCAVDAP